MNFGMNHIQGAGSIVRPVDLLTCSPALYYCATTAPFRDEEIWNINEWTNSNKNINTGAMSVTCALCSSVTKCIIARYNEVLWFTLDHTKHQHYERCAYIMLLISQGTGFSNKTDCRTQLIFYLVWKLRVSVHHIVPIVEVIIVPAVKQWRG